MTAIQAIPCGPFAFVSKLIPGALGMLLIAGMCDPALTRTFLDLFPEEPFVRWSILAVLAFAFGHLSEILISAFGKPITYFTVRWDRRVARKENSSSLLDICLRRIGLIAFARELTRYHLGFSKEIPDSQIDYLVGYIGQRGLNSLVPERRDMESGFLVGSAGSCMLALVVGLSSMAFSSTGVSAVQVVTAAVTIILSYTFLRGAVFLARGWQCQCAAAAVVELMEQAPEYGNLAVRQKVIEGIRRDMDSQFAAHIRLNTIARVARANRAKASTTASKTEPTGFVPTSDPFGATSSEGQVVANSRLN